MVIPDNSRRQLVAGVVGQFVGHIGPNRRVQAETKSSRFTSYVFAGEGESMGARQLLLVPTGMSERGWACCTGT